MPAVAANGKQKRKRPSSLLAAATSLPSVENSLDEFIARANETLVDTNAFNAEKVLKEEDEKRKEADALRWKATEQQMRESQAREESLRRQLDGLQGKLAEAEARAAVASAGGSQDGIIADLKVRLTGADERARLTEEKLRGAEERASKLAQELVATKAAAASLPAAAPPSMSFQDPDELEQRLHVAEAKASKALAVAKAAAAGLSINPADIAAIESGLVVPMDTGKKGSSWGLAFAALLVGGAVAFAAAFVMFNNKNEAPKAAAAGPATPAAVDQAQPQAAAPAAAPAKPTVTPIEEPAPAAAAATPEAKAPEAKTEAPAEKAAPAPEKVEAKAEPEKKAAPAKKASAPAKKAAKASKAPSGGLADPFGGGETTAPAKKAPKAAKKSGGDGGIVDPF